MNIEKGNQKQTVKTNREKAYLALNVFSAILAAFIFVCYLLYILGGTVLADSGGLLVSLLAILGTTLPFILHKQLKKLFGKAYFPLKLAYCTLMLIYVVSFSVFSAVMITKTGKEPVFDGRQTVIIVCGCKTNGMTPSKTLRKRLEKAYELLHKDPRSICIVTGGQGTDETVPESLAMKAYLEKKGIAGYRIYEEDASRNTVENIDLSIELMEENGIPRESNIICVSTDFHTARVAMLAEKAGLDAQVAAAPSIDALHFFASLVREFMSYIKYFTIG